MVSLVIPTYNERHNIAAFIQEVMLALEMTTESVVASRHIAKGGIREWSLARSLVSWGTTLIASVLLAKGHYETVAEVPYVFENRRAGESMLGATQCVEFCRHLGRLAWETGQLRRFGRFCIVGMVGLFVNEAALIGFTEVGNLCHVASAVLAVELAIINNFLWNEWWTFHDRSSRYPGIRQRLRRFVHYNVICATGAGLNVMTLWLLTDVTGLHYFISNLFGIGVATIWNYSLNANITWDLPVEYKVG